jgi:hypothetical protein
VKWQVPPSLLIFTRASCVAVTWQIAVEAIVPLNSAAGRGGRMQLLLFLDDLGPSLLGKPLLSRQACHVQEDLFRAQHITSLCKEPRASYEFSRARLTKPRPCQCERTTEASLLSRPLARGRLPAAWRERRSVRPPTADMQRLHRHVGFVPNCDIERAGRSKRKSRPKAALRL